VPCYLDESGGAFGIEVDSFRLRRDVDAVEDVESVGGWRNWLNVSPEGSLKRLPDSRKSVRQGNGFIGSTPVGAEAVAYQGLVEGLGGGLVGLCDGTGGRTRSAVRGSTAPCLERSMAPERRVPAGQCFQVGVPAPVQLDFQQRLA